MIKLEHVVLPSPEQMEFVIEGMRNPMNSWDKSDSCINFKNITVGECLFDNSITNKLFEVGDNDLSLMQKLSAAGTDHRKFMRMMPVMVRITAPLYWWKEFDTYKVGTVANSCSTMHKITEKEFTLEDFSTEHLMGWNDDFTADCLIDYSHAPDGYPSGKVPSDVINTTIRMLNKARENYLLISEALMCKKGIFGMTPECTIENLKQKQKDIWWQMIQLLPSSYNQTRNVMLNYEVLANIYHSRKNHKLDEWVEFCKWIETLPYAEGIFT